MGSAFCSSNHPKFTVDFSALQRSIVPLVLLDNTMTLKIGLVSSGILSYSLQTLHTGVAGLLPSPDVSLNALVRCLVRLRHFVELLDNSRLKSYCRR
jgi:hypothetical protein